MNEENQNTMFVDVQSVHSPLSLSELVKIACGEQIPFFEVSTGHFLKQWHNAKDGDKIIYGIDNVAVCQGNITFIKKKVFRPMWIADHEFYKCFVDFARAYGDDVFDKAWQEDMIKKHIAAIGRKRWLFVCFAVMEPTVSYHSNVELLKGKIREMDEAEREANQFVMCPLSDE